MATDGAVPLPGLVEEFVAGQQDGGAAAAAAGVKAGNFTILQLVEALGPTLTSSQSQTRARGIQLLSHVLSECSGRLSEKEVEVLVAFYENRLKDDYVVTPHVLHGIKALTKSPAWPPGLAISVLKSLFQDVHVQSLMLLERSCIYTILINLMELKEEELKGLGADFVFGFVQAMDGERDPRNLLLAFQIARNILHRGYELGSFTEELFEVTSCYFPIDFSPPPNDPHGITQQELILALRAVLTGTVCFAEFLLPLVIEKLDSDIQSAKLDSLQTLAACASMYGYRELKEFLPGLWSSLRREVFQTASEKVESAGLSSLRAITSCLSRSILSSDGDDALRVFLDLIIQDCRHHLCEPDLKLVWPSAKLLQAAASASYRASHIIAGAVIPQLMEQYNNQTQCAQRRTLLDVLQGFVQPAQDGVPAVEESVLCGFREPLCEVVFSALSETNAGLQVTASRILSSLGQQPGLLSTSHVELAVDHLRRLILEEEDTQVCPAVLECSGSLAPLYPDVFASAMIPQLKAEIFSEPMLRDNGQEAVHTSSQHVVRQRCMTALAAVSCHPTLVQQTAPVLLQVLSSSHTDVSFSIGSGLFSTDDIIAACRSLQQIAEQVQYAEETGCFFHDVIIPHLLGLTVQAGLQCDNQDSIPPQSPLTEEAILLAIVPVLSTACAHLQSELAALTASRVVSLFLDGDTVFLPGNNLPLQPQLFQKASSSCSGSQLVCLLMACVCSMPKSVEIPQVDRLLSELEELSCTSTHPFSFTLAAKCFAGLINKRSAGQALDLVLERTIKRITSELDCMSSSLRTQALTLLLWVAKALLIRYHPLATTLTDKIFSLLMDPELAPLAADGFSLLMSDSVDVLNRACHADFRIMYRQRFFTENSAKLVEGFNSAEKEMKSGYLKALSHIVNNLPRQVQLTELPALLPLLLEALSCPDQAVQLSTLSCLHPVLLDPPASPALAPQLDGLIFRLLGLTTSPAMKVRIATLRCLHALARFPDHMILPFRARVLRALATPLDDHKRLVRREAVAARGEWFLLGSPGR
ncbi:MMS19 nucleotide excision repair protein homolog isoform X2 [Scleropages formosus]|uniref:MMS19 nucleotide excision repair protein homolog isoform X2 n=1 Tax=Scleropages formosus TaxID=113540 RepID=UPI0010FA798B|nr:MMS19 nucleotide excision repair protein homolog isoform X2 [Scleropages formosus]